MTFSESFLVYTPEIFGDIASFLISEPAIYFVGLAVLLSVVCIVKRLIHV